MANSRHAKAHFFGLSLPVLALVAHCGGADNTLIGDGGADSGHGGTSSGSTSGGGGSGSGSSGGSSSGGGSGSSSGSSSGGSSGSSSGSSSGGSSDGGSELACGSAGDCPTGDYCHVSEGLHLGDGGLGSAYACDPYPATCNGTPTCQCITLVSAGCTCSQSSAGFTVTCQYP